MPRGAAQRTCRIASRNAETPVTYSFEWSRTARLRARRVPETLRPIGPAYPFSRTALRKCRRPREPPIAAIAPSIGHSAANTITTTTFYDDDSGGDSDPRVEFVAPQDGTYLLKVNDLTDATVGCYRYQVMLR